MDIDVTVDIDPYEVLEEMKVKERFPEASSSTLGKLARKAIKFNKEKK